MQGDLRGYWAADVCLYVRVGWWWRRTGEVRNQPLRDTPRKAKRVTWSGVPAVVSPAASLVLRESGLLGWGRVVTE